VTGIFVLIVVFFVVLTIVRSVRRGAGAKTTAAVRSERNFEKFVKLEAMIEARGENTQVADILRAALEARSSGESVTVDLQRQATPVRIPAGAGLREILAAATAAAAANADAVPFAAAAKHKHKEPHPESKQRPEPKNRLDFPVAPGTRPPLAALGARPPLAAARARKALEPLQPLQELAAPAARSNAWRY
jgi:hypothetical protein